MNVSRQRTTRGDSSYSQEDPRSCIRIDEVAYGAGSTARCSSAESEAEYLDYVSSNEDALTVNVLAMLASRIACR
jgi:hypothetical protein